MKKKTLEKMKEMYIEAMECPGEAKDSIIPGNGISLAVTAAYHCSILNILISEYGELRAKNFIKEWKKQE